MNVLYLPGNSILNKDEAYTIKSFLEEKGHSVYVHEWRHWADESIEWDLAKEIEIIKTHNLELIDVVIGKSIGSFVSSKIVNDKLVNPKKVIILGLPLGSPLISIDDYEGCIEIMQNNITVIQNDKDPYGPLDKVKELINKSFANLIIKNSDTHIYSYPEDILKALS